MLEPERRGGQFAVEMTAVKRGLPLLVVRLFRKVLRAHDHIFQLRNHRPVFIRHIPAHAELLQQLGRRVKRARVILHGDAQLRHRHARRDPRQAIFSSCKLLPIRQLHRQRLVLNVAPCEHHIVVLHHDLVAAAFDVRETHPEPPRVVAVTDINRRPPARLIHDGQLRAGDELDVLLEIRRRQLRRRNRILVQHDVRKRPGVFNEGDIGGTHEQRSKQQDGGSKKGG